MKLNLSCLSIGFLLAFSGVGAQQSQLESAAKRWIIQNSNELGLKSHHDTDLNFSRKGSAGETLRFQQMIQGVPVFQSEIVVHFNNKGAVTYTSESLQKEAANISVTPALSAQTAMQTAKTALNLQGQITDEQNKLYVLQTENNETKLVYRVVLSSFDTPGNWEAMIDAQNGNVISIKDIAIYYHGKDGHDHGNHRHDHEPPIKSTVNTVATGTGYIFNPDPLSQTGSNYGGQYTDGNDATNASLDAARTLVDIPELELAGGMYKLKGTYAEIKELEAPTTGLFTQASNAFLFNRNEQGFEAVNAYWHVDKSMRYINETLGIECLPMTNGGVVWFDPHGLGGDDNSYYTNGRLVFGEGGVDDAEDADVIIHELGHGIHDWMTNGSLSQVNGLSEGSGDYWAQSYSRDLNQWEESDPQYQWVFNWDGHNPFWQGRTTGYNATYPGGLTGQIHTDGQIWATSLMRIWDRIGREKTDRAFLEGLALTNSSTNQQNAARAVRQAALDMVGQFGFTCADIIVMTEEFTQTGYNMPAYDCEDMAVNDLLNGKIASVYPNPVSDKLNIVMDFKKPETVIVMDMTGRKVLETQIGSNKSFINVGNLSKGVYVLSIKGTSFTHKFVKE
ncbi:T9SS type A sorting domain-containing protein [Moheibacter sediminis]|uniref:Por secretion system C-terminal sorting domain-containing protein n=1 Tax=Moheibacter sediminis TaxID=1434700 RepID=A0A1W2C263_9FLAO|nr:T9SS type A sorting domain-containing protein [Moheibacter sediminis]SMC79337.1 Por secretion system C-terminal sorting domain-containing protein [Moheibacter sediminis]